MALGLNDIEILYHKLSRAFASHRPTEDGAGTGGGGEVAAQGGEQGRFAGTVGPEQDPVLSSGDFPGDVLEDSDAPAEDSQLAEGKNGAGGQGA